MSVWFTTNLSGARRVAGGRAAGQVSRAFNGSMLLDDIQGTESPSPKPCPCL